MIDECKTFADEYKVMFNVKKRFVIVKTQPLYNVYLDGQDALRWSDNIVHLDNHLKYDLSDDTDMNKKGDFMSSVSRRVAKFGFVQNELLKKLFFNSCPFYGSQAWELSCM